MKRNEWSQSYTEQWKLVFSDNNLKSFSVCRLLHHQNLVRKTKTYLVILIEVMECRVFFTQRWKGQEEDGKTLKINYSRLNGQTWEPDHGEVDQQNGLEARSVEWKLRHGRDMSGEEYHGLFLPLESSASASASPRSNTPKPVGKGTWEMSSLQCRAEYRKGGERTWEQIGKWLARASCLPIGEPRNAEPTSSPGHSNSVHTKRIKEYLTCYIWLNAWISKSHSLWGS